MSTLKANQELIDLFVSEALKKVCDKIYPIGSVYISVKPGNPSTIFGGTWIRIKNGYLYGVEGDHFERGEVLDANNGTYTNYHTLTIGQMPKHSHTIYAGYGDESSGASSDSYRYQYWGGHSRGWKAGNLGTGENGGGEGHYHKIPCACVIIWRRTA